MEWKRRYINYIPYIFITQSSTQKQYYYEIFNGISTNSLNEISVFCNMGTIGSGSLGQNEDSPSNAYLFSVPTNPTWVIREYLVLIVLNHQHIYKSILTEQD